MDANMGLLVIAAIAVLVAFGGIMSTNKANKKRSNLESELSKQQSRYKLLKDSHDNLEGLVEKLTEESKKLQATLDNTLNELEHSRKAYRTLDESMASLRVQFSDLSVGIRDYFTQGRMSPKDIKTVRKELADSVEALRGRWNLYPLDWTKPQQGVDTGPQESQE